MGNKILIGKVISTKMDKSCVMQIIKKTKHAKYEKYIKKITKLHVHDEQNSCKVNDIIQVISCRPISKTKFWKLLTIHQK